MGDRDTVVEINSIKLDQAVVYWSGSFGMSGPGRSGRSGGDRAEVHLVQLRSYRARVQVEMIEWKSERWLSGRRE
ncbi:hypothetical protein DPMN_160586 [Dreissena polymorpha]|uniref:Uncharacterized protein n=1 Tax=Dreissena polymorpha TaxID=45954 RepID=A0A9D4ELT4_DREPO|nr:hypothetical protein DPMN_160586 [Dreissena polymorpha]